MTGPNQNLRRARLRLGWTLDDVADGLHRLTRDQRDVIGVNSRLASLSAPTPVDHEYIAAIHATIGDLVAVEVRHGGDDVAPLAVRAFDLVRRRLAAGGHPAALGRELTAAAGELAEVAGWLLHDADRQDEARRLSFEALHLARLAGDRSIELLTMSNMAFVSLFQGLPGEALLLARSVLADHRLTTRQRVIFRLREARALAQLGDVAAGLRIAAEALSAFEDGATGDNPEWSWWVDTGEVIGHLAGVHLEAGDPRTAVRLLGRSVEASPNAHPNNQLFRLARLLDATMRAGIWSDAETVLAQVMPCLRDVRSGRAARVLRASVERIERGNAAPPSIVESGRRLRDLLGPAGR